jgi:hypothetical protein
MPYIKKFNIDASKPPEQIIQDINSFLRKCSKHRKILSSKISHIDSITLPAVNLKRKLEEQIVPIKKCKPAGKNTKPSSPQPDYQNLSGEQLYNLMSEEQRKELQSQLLKGVS